jgi:hypothetical protein
VGYVDKSSGSLWDRGTSSENSYYRLVKRIQYSISFLMIIMQIRDYSRVVVVI